METPSTTTVSTTITANLPAEIRLALWTLTRMNGGVGPDADAVLSMIVSAAVLMFAEADADEQNRSLARAHASAALSSGTATPEHRRRAEAMLQVCGRIPTGPEVLAFYVATDSKELARLTDEVNRRTAA